MLSNGVPIESVVQILGHRSLKTTRISAKVIDGKLTEDIQILKERFKKQWTVSLAGFMRI